jgi:RNA polymerase sigma-70 factor (ECF subfamily)
MPDDRPCLTRAWRETRGELHGWLRHRFNGDAEADDLLQEVFLRALRQGEGFCAVDNPRAWLFQVARNALADRQRVTRTSIPLPDDLAAPTPETTSALDDLSQCLPRVLSELSADDRFAISFCDIEGHSQQALAEHLGITLSGAKSRLQRARQRLKLQLVSACRVSFDGRGQVIDFVPRPPLG